MAQAAPETLQFARLSSPLRIIIRELMLNTILAVTAASAFRARVGLRDQPLVGRWAMTKTPRKSKTRQGTKGR